MSARASVRPASRSGEDGPRDYAIVGATLVVGDDLDVVDDHFIAVSDGQIVAIDRGTPPGRTSVIDLSGHLVIPGMINCHTHIGDSAFKEHGFGMEEWPLLGPPDGLKHQLLAAASREQLIRAMRGTLREMLRLGTIAFADFREQGVAGAELLVEAAADLPILPIILGRFAVPPPHVEEEFRTNQAALPPGYRDEIDRILDVCDGFTVVTANDTTDAGLIEAAAAVRSRGKLLAVHAAEIERYREISVSRTGASDVNRVVDHLTPDFIVHMTVANDEELDAVGAAAIPVVVCPRTQGALGNGLPPIAALAARGIPVAIGTDNAMLTSPDLFRDLDYLSRGTRAAARDPSWPDPRFLLGAVTTVAARALGVEDRLGSLAVGKHASMVVLDLATDNLSGSGDPLASVIHRAGASDISAVIVQGRVASGQLEAA